MSITRKFFVIPIPARKVLKVGYLLQRHIFLKINFNVGTWRIAAAQCIQ